MVCGSHQLCGMLRAMLIQYCLYICRGEGPIVSECTQTVKPACTHLPHLTLSLPV